MDLFPKSDKDIFRKRIFVKDSDSDLLETPSIKWQLRQWESATQHLGDNETALDTEMRQTLDQVNGFLHRLEVLVLVHSKRRHTGTWIKDWSKYQAMERDLRDQVVLGHRVMERVKELLELEETGIRLSKSFQSSSNSNRSFGLSFLSTQESDESINQSFKSSRYTSELKDVLRKLSQILKNQGKIQPPQIQDLEMAAYIKESSLAGSKRDSLQFLMERLAMDNIQPIFLSQPSKGSESTCTVSCKVFNINVDGKASEKSAAKKAAAVKMLERLTNDCLQKKMMPQITPFTDFEMKEAVEILCETEHYEEVLAQLCGERRKAAPHYEVQTLSSKHSVQVRCSALRLQGYGTHTNFAMAKRAAAREVLLQLKQKPKY